MCIYVEHRNTVENNKLNSKRTSKTRQKATICMQIKALTTFSTMYHIISTENAIIMGNSAIV